MLAISLALTVAGVVIFGGQPSLPEVLGSEKLASGLPVLVPNDAANLAVAGSVVVVGSRGDEPGATYSAWDRRDGSLIWSRHFNFASAGILWFDDGLVVVKSSDGMLGIDPADGTDVWTAERAAEPVDVNQLFAVVPSPTGLETRNVVADYLLVQARHRYFGLDPASGAEVFAIGFNPDTDDVDGRGDLAAMMIQIDDYSVVRAIDGRSLQVQWQWAPPVPNAIDYGVAEGGTIAVSTTSGVYALDVATGEELWSVPSVDNCWNSAEAVDDGVVYIRRPDSLMAVKLETGQELWRTRSNTGPYIDWSATTPHHIIQAEPGNLFGIYLKSDGTRIYEVDVDRDMVGRPHVADDHLFFRWKDELHSVSLADLPVEPIDSPVVPHASLCEG